MTHILEHNGDIDPLAAGQDMLSCRAVDHAGLKMIHVDNIVDGRIKGYGIDHSLTSQMFS